MFFRRTENLYIHAGAIILLILLNVFVAPAADSVNTNERMVTKIAEGVYVIRHKDSPDGNFNGNTTVIIGDREVFVVDSCFQLSAAAEDIAQIRQWTDKPVRYLLITHWHNDHNMGNGLYMSAFPAMEIIAHTDTKKNMYRTPNTPSRFGQQVAIRERRIASRQGADGKSLTEEQLAALRKNLAGKRQVLEELKTFVYQAPTITFEKELTIDIGGREVEVKHPGRGTTSGDTVVYLPKEKILIAGDLLTHPVLYTYDGYPSEWVRTLENIGQLDVGIIVPGHGDVLRDKNFLYLSRDLLKSVVEQVNSQLGKLTSIIENPPLEDVRKGVDLSSFRRKFAGDDAETGEAFDDAAAALVRITYNEAMHNL